MRTDKYMMAKAWMKQDQAPQSEALDTWNTLEAEFNEERKAMLMASAESDKIKAMMNKKYGPGTMKYGSEIKQPEIKTPQAIFEFTQRNPAAEGGRIPFDNGGDVEAIAKKTEPLNKGEKLKLYRSYDNLFKQEYKRLVSLGDPFSKIDLNRAVINRIAKENPTINLQDGIGLDKIPGGGNEESKTLFERYDKATSRGPIFNKKELKNFTQGNAVKATSYTKTQENIFKELLKGNNDLSSLTKNLKISEGRLSYNMEKLMRNLAKGSGDQYTFLKNYKEKDLEKVRNNVYESPTLENAYQRTIIQSVLQSTKLGSPERKKALNKLKEFNKFKKVMTDNGLDPKILSLDHAASYRALKNGNIKSFLSVTPVIRDINTLKSAFDKRSQLNLRRMQEYLKSGDNKNYKYFLKNQTELENLWKTMTGGQSSLGKIRVTATGPKKGTIKIYDYGATSLLDKNKNLVDELANNLDIRKNVVNASSVENLDEARRIMLEGSELTEKKMLGTFSSTDRAARTNIDKSFKNLNKPEMFKIEKQIKSLIETIGCPDGVLKAASGGNCLTKGTELINNGMKDASQASMRNFSKFANSALKLGRNLIKFGVIPEAMFIGAESLVRMGMGDTLSEASKQAVGFYLDPIFGTNFKKEGAFSKMAGDVGTDMAFDVAKLNEYKEALAKKESIESNKKSALAVNDESLTGLTDQEVAAQYDANIAKAQAELNKRMLTETERVDFENKADTAADVAGVNSPVRQAIGKARSDTEMMRYEDDFSGMQSDMFTQDPMSQKAKTERLSNLLPQKSMRPGLSKFVNFDDRQLEQLSGLTKKPVKELRNYQEYLNKERGMSLLEQEQIFGKEQTYGTQGNFFGEKIKQKPMYDYAEGGITGLRSKYEYKK